jgi:tetratricopeptide (TPR) repeat protein
VDEEDSLTHIYLTASSEGRHLVDSYVALQRAEMPNFSLIMMFGRILCLMGQYTKARTHFERLTEAGHEDQASIEHNLGFVYAQQQNYEEAIQHYAQARSLLQEADPPRLQELAVTLNNMAAVFSQVNQCRYWNIIGRHIMQCNSDTNFIHLDRQARRSTTVFS